VVRARIEASNRRIGRLKREYLKLFCGVTEGELENRLRLLDHRRLVDEIHGSL
jgi:hypothetical protein